MPFRNTRMIKIIVCGIGHPETFHDFARPDVPDKGEGNDLVQLNLPETVLESINAKIE